MHSTRSNFDKVWVWNERLCLLHSPLLDKMKCTWIFGGISLDLSPNGTYVPRNITIASSTMISSIVQCTILCSFACLIPFGSLKFRSYVVNPVVISLFSSSASLSHTASLARSNCDCLLPRSFILRSLFSFALCTCVCSHTIEMPLRTVYTSQPADFQLPIAQWRMLIVVWT